MTIFLTLAVIGLAARLWFVILLQRKMLNDIKRADEYITHFQRRTQALERAAKKSVTCATGRGPSNDRES